jgi:hypothetical protein
VSDTLLLLAIMAGVAAATFVIARSPTFWLGLIKVLLTAMLPSLTKTLRPKNLTKKQLDEIARGEDPFSTRPFGRQKGE